MAKKHSTVAPDAAAAPTSPAVDTRPQRPGLDGIDPNNLPAGVRVLGEWSGSIVYTGADSALIAGGIIHREWIVDLGPSTRRIMLDAGGAFTIIGEGLRGSPKGGQREHGAYGIRRGHDGLLQVTCYRTCSEKQAHKMAEHNKRNAEAERDAWIRTKAAHSVTDFAARWKNGVLAHLDQVTGFFEGKMRFNDFPDVKISSQDQEAVRLAAAELQRVIAAVTPKLDDAESEPASNVIALRRDGHRLLRDTH